MVLCGRLAGRAVFLLPRPLSPPAQQPCKKRVDSDCLVGGASRIHLLTLTTGLLALTHPDAHLPLTGWQQARCFPRAAAMAQAGGGSQSPQAVEPFEAVRQAARSLGGGGGDEVAAGGGDRDMTVTTPGAGGKKKVRRRAGAGAKKKVRRRAVRVCLFVVLSCVTQRNNHHAAPRRHQRYHACKNESTATLSCFWHSPRHPTGRLAAFPARPWLTLRRPAVITIQQRRHRHSTLSLSETASPSR